MPVDKHQVVSRSDDLAALFGIRACGHHDSAGKVLYHHAQSAGDPAAPQQETKTMSVFHPDPTGLT
jgi:hypothetical protein